MKNAILMIGLVCLFNQTCIADSNLPGQQGCLSCHSIDKKILGPSFKSVAARYKNDPSAFNMLVDKVKKGGSGNWGNLPMPANSPHVSDDNINSLVSWVLSLDSTGVADTPIPPASTVTSSPTSSSRNNTAKSDSSSGVDTAIAVLSAATGIYAERENQKAQNRAARQRNISNNSQTYQQSNNSNESTYQLADNANSAGNSDAGRCVGLKENGRGAIGGFVNNCNFRVNYTYCVFHPNQASFSTAFDCELRKFGSGSIIPHSSDSAHTNGEYIYYSACADPYHPRDVSFELGKGVIGNCVK